MTDLRQALLIAAEAKLKERNRWATTHCQCEACKNGNIHDSDCSVHNGDALPVGPCDCSLATPPQQQAEPTCPDCKAAVLYECVACSSNNYPPQQQAEPVLQEIEQYRMQMAGISTAAIGYWKEGDGIHPDYDTLALRDVAKLYAKYDELYKAQPEQQAEPVAKLFGSLPVYDTTPPQQQAEPVQEPYESPYNPNAVEYQYHYPDGSWSCSNGEVINGMHPDRARSLYALKDNT